MAADYSRQAKWHEKITDHVGFIVPKGKRELIQAYATKHNLTMGKLIIKALESYTGLEIARQQNESNLEIEKGE